MKKSSINLLLILLGVAILLAGYLAIYKPTVEKTDAVNQEREALMPELNTLQGYYRNLDTYYTGIEDSQKIIKEETERYGYDIRNEDQVMYMLNLEASTGIVVDSIRFSGLRQLLSYPQVVEVGEESMERYVWQNGVSFNCLMDYDQLKSLVDFVNESNPRTSLESIMIAYASDTGILNGTASINRYFISGKDYVYIPTDIYGIEIGNDNPFASLSAEEAADGTLSEEAAAELAESGVVILDN